MEMDAVTYKLLKLKYGVGREGMTRAQMEGVMDLCRTIQPDRNFPSVDWLERWGSDLVENCYATVDVDGKQFTHVKSDTLLKLFWSNTKIRSAIQMRQDCK